MKQIVSLNNEFIKNIAKLKEKKYRDKERLFIIEGYHLVLEASDYLKYVFIVKEDDFIEGVENILVTEEIIKKLSSTVTPQSIIGVCRYLDDIVIDYQKDKYLLLDNIQDPGNLGTIVRSALGFNIDYCILSKDCVDIYNDKFIRSTQGAFFKVKIVYEDLLKVINKMKENDIEVIGTALRNSLDLKEIIKIKRYAIVLGNEANGVSKSILDRTDYNVRIEISKKLESLNVSVAASIIMFYLDK